MCFVLVVFGRKKTLYLGEGDIHNASLSHINTQKSTHVCKTSDQWWTHEFKKGFQIVDEAKYSLHTAAVKVAFAI